MNLLWLSLMWFGSGEGVTTEQTHRLRGRRGQRHYRCQRCDLQYYEDQVIVHNGLVLCTGRNTLNCVDKPGYRAAFNHMRPIVEEPPRELPIVDEDL